MTQLLPVPYARFAATILLALAAVSANALSYDIPRDDDIRIDGNPADWSDAGLEVGLLDRFARYDVLTKPTGEATLRLAWSEEGLLIYSRVTDAVRFEEAGNSLHRGDSIEWFLAREPGASSTFQSITSPGVAGSKHATPRSNTYVYGELPKPAANAITYAGGPTEDGYWLEALIRWDAAGIKPAKGTSVGFQQIINDRDVDGSKIGDSIQRNAIDYICFFPDRETYKNTAFMHTLVLADKPSPAVRVWPELSVNDTATVLEIAAVPAWNGKPLRVSQNGKSLGEAILTADAGALVSSARVALTGFAPQGPSLQLTVDERDAAEVPLYRALPEAETARLRTLLSTADEKERLSLLRALQAATKQNPALQRDIETLLPVVEMWAEGREMAAAGKLANPSEYLLSSVTATYPPAIRKDSPLYPLFCLYRGRNLVWTIVQLATLHDIAIKPDGHYTVARKLFAEAQAVVPDNPIINMYLGQPIPWPAPAPDPQAPDWANSQRVILEHLDEIVQFWTKERQLPNGSFGGEWGDDVEMWRNWLPVLLAFENPTAVRGQELLAENIYKQAHMEHTYSSIMTDVEHASEDSADTLTPMLYLKPESKEWRARALQLADYMKNTWTGENQQGNLMFKSIVFNYKGVSGNKLQAYDTTLDTRAIQPLLVHWQQTHDPEITPLITKWLDTWVEAAASNRDGKPAGILPTAINWPTGRIGGPSGQWWKAEAFSVLYDWPWYVSDMLHTLLIAYQVTGDEKYLEPVRSMGRIRADFLERQAKKSGRSLSELNSDNVMDGTLAFINTITEAQNGASAFEPGSLDWAADKLGPVIPGALNTYRRLTGDKQFDTVILHDGGGYGRWVVKQDIKALEESLARTAEAFSFNRPVYTTEVRWTDRAFRFTAAYLNTYAEPKLPVPDTRLAYNAVSGEVSTWQGARFAAVRWLTPPRNIAALVKTATTRELEAQLYNFSQTPIQMGVETFLLAPGDYTLTVYNELGEEDAAFPLKSDGTSSKTYFEIASRSLCTVRITSEE